MCILKGKRVLLLLTSSIAIYKSVYILRGLIQKGCDVKVLMTKSCLKFMSPLCFSVLSNKKVEYNFEHDGIWTNYIEYSLWADFVLIAPCTANTIGKMASGICDNVVLACYFSSRSKVYFAPAMDLDMMNNTTILNNINKLKNIGNVCIYPEDGYLASGLRGYGRLRDPMKIISFIEDDIKKDLLIDKYNNKFSNKNIIICVGSSKEKIDPVRFISNFSSGIMGYELTKIANLLGANITVVLGDTNNELAFNDIQNINIIKVYNSYNMYKELMLLKDTYDILIMTAAVPDYIPDSYSNMKIKKIDNQDFFNLKLKKNVDILKSMSLNKRLDQIIVGFALETNNAIENAKAKITEKNIDLLILNKLNQQNKCFGNTKNNYIIIDKNYTNYTFNQVTKKNMAINIFDYINNLFYK